MAEKHPARTPEHTAGDLEALRSRLLAKRGRHLFADDFDACAEGMHGNAMIPGSPAESGNFDMADRRRAAVAGSGQGKAHISLADSPAPVDDERR